MIMIALKGRLGNQMFQYAAGRALSYRLRTKLGLDTYFVEKNKLPFQLHKFNIKCEQIPQKMLPPRKDSNWLNRGLWRLGLKKPKVFHQNGLGYNPNINKVVDDTYLIGYWQSEKFFIDCKKVIKSDFEIISPPTNQNLETYQEILESPLSISLHIRRGDYLKGKNPSVHGGCSLIYYEKAVSRIVEQVFHSTPNLFVFSDDPEWVSENINLPFPIRIICHNPPENAIEDLRLMSVCKHHVIANSSFSWWGAWLGRYENKIIVAPSRWFACSKLNNPDIYCNNWIKIEN